MADLKISQLTDGSPAELTDYVAVSRVAGVATRRISISSIVGLASGISGSGVSGQIPFFVGANILSGDSGWRWDNSAKGVILTQPVPSPSARPTALALRSPNNANIHGMIGLVQKTSEGNHYLLIQSVEDSVGWRDVILSRDGGKVGIGTPDPNAKMHVMNGGVVLGPAAGGDKGEGTLNLSGSYYADNVMGHTQIITLCGGTITVKNGLVTGTTC